MFKKLLVLGIGAVALTGCNSTDLELYNLMNEATEFDAYEFINKGSIEIIAGQDSASIGFEQTGYASQIDVLNSESTSIISIDYSNMLTSGIKQTQAEIDQAIEDGDMQTVEYLGHLMETFEEMQQLFEDMAETPLIMTQYIIDNVCYISTDYLTQMAKLTGEEFDMELADYIDYGDIFEGLSLEVVEELLNDFENTYSDLLATLLDVSAEGLTTKENDIFTVNLGTEEIVTICANLMDNVIYNLDMFNDMFALGVDNSEIIALQAEYNELKPQFVEMAKLFLNANLTLQYYNIDGVHYQYFDMYVGMNPLFNAGEVMGMQMTMTTEVFETQYRDLTLNGTVMSID